ncbi:MAG: FAD-binding protein [Natrialbaceae archaeon]|nr:FAD-binding protein [Natrialbaceae archaeon]
MTDTTWTNWSGEQTCTPRQFHRPSTEEQLQTIVADANEAGKTVRVAGAGHSFSPVVPTRDELISLEHYTGLVDVDEDEQTATVRAGTPLWELNELLDAHGLAMENLGDVDRQSVAGALIAGTHGTGTGLGILATQIRGIRLITADGEPLELTPEDSERFKAAQVSLGALGVVSTLTLDLEPALACNSAATRCHSRRFSRYFPSSPSATATSSSSGFPTPRTPSSR